MSSQGKRGCSEDKGAPARNLSRSVCTALSPAGGPPLWAALSPQHPEPRVPVSPAVPLMASPSPTLRKLKTAEDALPHTAHPASQPRSSSLARGPQGSRACSYPAAPTCLRPGSLGVGRGACSHVAGAGARKPPGDPNGTQVSRGDGGRRAVRTPRLTVTVEKFRTDPKPVQAAVCSARTPVLGEGGHPRPAESLSGWAGGLIRPGFRAREDGPSREGQWPWEHIFRGRAPE